MSQLMSVRRIAAAVRLMDSFTGQAPDTAGLFVKMKDGAVPVKKADGYYIFWDNGRRKRTLMVEGAGYEREEITLDIHQMASKGQPTFCIWLKPGRSYLYPAEIRVEERLESPGGKRILPGEEAVFPIEESAGCIRLAEAYPLDQLNPLLIHLQAPPDMELENRQLWIRDIQGREEHFTIWAVKNRALGLFVLKEPLTGIYGPYEAELFLTMVLRADSHGCLRVPVNC